MGGMTLEEWAGQAYVAAHLSPCFEPETDDDAGWEAVAKKEIEWSVSAIVEINRAAIAEEREACMRDMCPYCLQGEPIVEPAECIAMGHYYNDSIICHPLGRDKEGHVTGHVGCAAAAIRIRGKA